MTEQNSEQEFQELQKIKRQHTLDGLKFLNDWSKWLVAIETGVIAVIGTMVKAETLSSMGKFSVFPKGFICLSIIAFVISIFAASMILLSLPTLTQRLATDDVDQDIFDMHVDEFSFNIDRLADIQYWSFGVGISGFSLAIIIRVLLF